MTFSKNGLSLFFEPLYFRREFFGILLSYSCQHYLFRFVKGGLTPLFIPFTECSATQALRPDQISVCFLDPINFRCPFLKPRNKGDFDHWAFTLSLKDGSFQAYFMVVIKKMTIFISLRKAHFWNTPPFFGHFGTFILVLGCFPFDSGPYQPLSDFFPLNLWFF